MGNTRKPAINYRTIFSNALKLCLESHLFPEALTPETSKTISERIFPKLPESGCMLDLSTCIEQIDEAVSLLGSDAGGALFLTLSSMVVESSGRAVGTATTTDARQYASSASTGAGGASTSAGAPSPSTHKNPLLGLPLEAQVDFMMMQLEEPERQREYFYRVLEARGADGVWQLMLETSAAIARMDPITVTLQGRDRTTGGTFIQLEKQKAAAAKTVQVVAAAPPPIQLRQYQARCVDMMMVPGRNFIVAAPTGSGKTAIFVEVSRRMLQSNTNAKILVIVPTVPLTVQQYAQFVKSGDDFGPRKWQVEHYSGEKPLPPTMWTTAFKTLSVLVCTAQLLVNALNNSDDFELDQIDLLVLDECHHVAKESPYAVIMQNYDADVNTRTKVLGFSASPVNGSHQLDLMIRMGQLRARLRAELIAINEEDEEVAKVISTPKEKEVVVAARPYDELVAQNLTNIIWAAAADIGRATNEVSQREDTSPASVLAIQVQSGVLAGAVTKTERPKTLGPAQGMTELEQWNRLTADMAARLKLRNLGLCCKFVECCCRALALASDAGYEAALQYLARKCCGLAVTYHQPPPPSVADAAAAATAANASATASVTALTNGGDAMQTDDLSSPAASTSMEVDPLQALRAHVRTGPSARAIYAEIHGRGAAEAEQRGERCSDITGTSVVQLANSFLRQQQLNSAEGQEYVRRCFQCGVFSQDTTFPKFWALKEYLLNYRDRPNGFHGIVFVAVRQVVYFLADTIRRCSDLSFIEVCEFTGHTATSNEKQSNMDATTHERERHTRGLSQQQQQRTMEMFREPGNKLLVATSAAEEGIDVPNCEFVVRYNAAASGTQRLQSRGRARVLQGSEFVCLLQEDTMDHHLHRKSEREEAAMREFMGSHAKAQRVT